LLGEAAVHIEPARHAARRFGFAHEAADLVQPLGAAIDLEAGDEFDGVLVYSVPADLLYVDVNVKQILSQVRAIESFHFCR
jgi:hypothetical protein